MDDVKCSGSERTLQSCNHSPSHNCGGSEGAGVVCGEGKHLGSLGLHAEVQNQFSLTNSNTDNMP